MPNKKGNGLQLSATHFLLALPGNIPILYFKAEIDLVRFKQSACPGQHFGQVYRIGPLSESGIIFLITGKQANLLQSNDITNYWRPIYINCIIIVIDSVII